MRLEIFRKILERDHDAGMIELAQLQELSKSQVREMRSYVRNMRPLDVEGASITAATRRLIDEFQKESGIAVTLVGGERPFSSPPEMTADVMQLIREALNNVRKHSKRPAWPSPSSASEKFSRSQSTTTASASTSAAPSPSTSSTCSAWAPSASSAAPAPSAPT
jgi:hypothetical protein